MHSLSRYVQLNIFYIKLTAFKSLRTLIKLQVYLAIASHFLHKLIENPHVSFP